MGRKNAWDSFKEAAGAPVNAVKTAAEGGSVRDVVKAGGKASLGGQVLSGVSGNPNSAFSRFASGDFGGSIDAMKSHKGDKADALAKQMQEKEEEQYGKNTEFNKQIGSADDDYLGTMGDNAKKYQGDLDGLRGEIEASQKDAGSTYSNQTQPRLKNLMETAQKNSAGAMSLQDAMDPNNAVATKTRALYEQQAQNENRQGMANTGTMQALGMQNMAGQMGNSPMTGGQLQAMMGANQAQAGAAYAKSQNRIQGLRDQGLQQGYDRSDKAYNQGLDATANYRNSVGDYESAADRQQGRNADFRNQRGDLSNKTYGLQQQMNDATRGVSQGKTQREMANYNTHMGGQQANLGAQIQTINGQQAADAAMKTGAMQAAGTAAGAYFGGPAGAAAGGQAGKAAGDANAPTATAQPQYGNYNNARDQGPPAYASQGSNMQLPPDEGGQNYSPGQQMGPPAPPETSYAGSSAGAQMGQGLGLTGGFQANPYAYQDPKKSRRA